MSFTNVSLKYPEYITLFGAKCTIQRGTLGQTVLLILLLFTRTPRLGFSCPFIVFCLFHKSVIIRVGLLSGLVYQ